MKPLTFVSLLSPAINHAWRRQSERVSTLGLNGARDHEPELAGLIEIIGNMEHGTLFKPATAADRDALVRHLRALKYSEPVPAPGSPNLDAMQTEELEAFAVAYERRPRRKHARAMFPTAKRGHVNALQSLGHYARNLLTARQCRIRGDIPAAQIYETIAGGIYSRLPLFARW